MAAAGWTYPRQAAQIRAGLLAEQQGFCAYSECFAAPPHSVEVEHFDPRKKGTGEDGYRNWYAVLRWCNAHKPKRIEPYLPILCPYDEGVGRRIRYADGQLQPVDGDDVEAQHLIDFLGWNRPELAYARAAHVGRVREVRDRFFGGSNDRLSAWLAAHPEDRSYITALEAELGLDLSAAERS